VNQFTKDTKNTETSHRETAIRFVELADQSWDRNKSVDLAQTEGIQLTDEHWAVIVYLRRYYLNHGSPIKSLTLENALNEQFSALGGSEYLYRLFPGGPVSQGSRFANLVNR
jgi:tRNA 2-thiouridine synthesizing protein E